MPQHFDIERFIRSKFLWAEQEKLPNRLHESMLQRPYRILPPNSVTSREYIQDRLNIYLDEFDTIIRISYG